jgi:SAM-dependent methyltransferase
MDPDFWDDRYQQQARWTAPVRRVFGDAFLNNEGLKILEVGCGTGVITTDLLINYKNLNLFGLDIKHELLCHANRKDPSIHYTCADGLSLPYQDGIFDITLCHYYLLWLGSPGQALAEMRRVTRAGGVVAALAEPDYRGRIDYPDDLENPGLLQARSLLEQGANPYLGRKLAELLHHAGLLHVHTGLLGGEWGKSPDPGFIQMEWEVLKRDLQDYLPESEINRLQTLDLESWRNGIRILFVPTFYTWGKVPG